MPHPDWRARLSINLDPYSAVALRDRIPHGLKARLFRQIIAAVCEAPDDSEIHVTVIVRGGLVVGWTDATEAIPTIALPPTEAPIEPPTEGNEDNEGNVTDQDLVVF